MELRVYPSRLRYWRCTLYPQCDVEIPELIAGI